jgi:hypothetical protein
MGPFIAANGNKDCIMVKGPSSGATDVDTRDLGMQDRLTGKERRLILMAPFVTMESGPMIDRFVAMAKLEFSERMIGFIFVYSIVNYSLSIVLYM